ncbi:MAG: hypothetical protein PF436_10290 [Prolixibacteraceae bacterium]|jgi:hypothetical protein|nr:hypothetical protein [Prolixibacteraceae bacterium]
MKTLTLSIVLLALALYASAQTDSVQAPVDSFEQLIEDETVNDTTIYESEIGMQSGDLKSGEKGKSKKDTLHVRIGNQNIEIITSDNDTKIKIDEEFDCYSLKTDKKKKKRKFNGHWGAFDFGANMFFDTDYSMYPEGISDFMEVRPEKSFEFNINFFEYSFGFGQYMGLVTGLGLNFNDYKFKNRYSIRKDDSGVIQPVDLPEGDFRKSKLSTLFLTSPLLFEFQIPDHRHEDRLYVAAGLIGGLKLGEHTKYKIGDEKWKDKGDYGIAPIRWGYTARIGFDDFGIFGTYYNTRLFEDGVGPAITPVTVGVTLAF